MLQEQCFYTGITNDLAARLVEHWTGKEGCFTSRYEVHYLVWSEESKYVLNAIDREKVIKDATRAVKDVLIIADNPNWVFRNEDVLGNWPPTAQQMEAALERWRQEESGRINDPLSFLRQIRAER